MTDSSINILNDLEFVASMSHLFTKTNYVDFKLEDQKIKIEYYQNNYGYRDIKDIHLGKPNDILAIGCSQTFGVGIPYEYTWPVMVERQTGMSTMSMGMCGASTEEIILNTITYLRLVGKPKYILAFLPDITRYFHVVDETFYKRDSRAFGAIKTYATSTHLETINYKNGEVYLANPIIKFPTYANKVIPPHEAVKQYLLSLYALETMCKLSDIQFVWSTWHQFTEQLFIEKIFRNNMIPVTQKNFFSYKKVACENHLIENIPDDKKNVWDFASDDMHMGIHGHIHASQGFLEFIK